MDRDPCPECGKPRGYLMEIDPNRPGVIDYWRTFLSDTPTAVSVVVVIACCVLAALLLVGAQAVLG